MNATVPRLTWRGLLARRRRVFGLVAAVFLAVAFLSGTLGLSATMTNAITSAFTTANQGTDAIVRNAVGTGRVGDPPTGPIPATVLGLVRGAPGVADARAEAKGVAAILGADGRLVTGMGPRNAGTWITDPVLNPWRLVAGSPPAAPDQVVIDRASASRGGLGVGAHTTVYTPQPVAVTVSGIAGYGSAASDGGASYVAFTLPAAQRYLLGGTNRVTDVIARARPGTTQDQLVAAIRRVLPPGTSVISGARATSDQIAAVDGAFLNYFKAFLGLFAGIALLVAALSVYNSFGVVAAGRSAELALLRAVGATRRQVLVGQVVEAAVLGLAGSVTGVVAGYGIAAGLKGAFAGLGLDLPIGGVVFTVGNAVLAIVLGVLVTLAAALAPALRAARTPPVAAMRDSQAEPARPAALRAGTGAVLAMAGAALTVVTARRGSAVAPVAVAALVTVVGVIVSGPVLAVATARVLGAPVARLRGTPGRLARRNAARAPARTAATASALLVGVAIVVLFTVFAASLRAATVGALAAGFRGDLVVTSGASASYGASGFSPRVASLIAAQPGVRAAAGTGAGQVRVDGAPQPVTVADPAALDQVFTAGVAPGLLAVSATAARAHGWHTGSTARVTFADGSTATMTVGSVYPPVSALRDYVVPAATWTAHDPAPLDTAVYIALRPGADRAAATAAVRAVADRYGRLAVSDRATFLAAAGAGVATILDIVYVMLALAILIALLSIGNTLALSVRERTREIGLLRAVGATRPQVRATVRWEAVLTAALGSTAGVLLGLFLGWALVRATGATAGIGTVAVPWPQVMIVLAAGAAAGLLAGARPAGRAARLDPLAALAAR